MGSSRVARWIPVSSSIPSTFPSCASSYDGQTKDALCHGLGVMTHPNSDRYDLQSGFYSKHSSLATKANSISVQCTVEGCTSGKEERKFSPSCCITSLASSEATGMIIAWKVVECVSRVKQMENSSFKKVNLYVIIFWAHLWSVQKRMQSILLLLRMSWRNGLENSKCEISFKFSLFYT